MSESKIVSLPGVGPPVGEPVPDVVAALRKWLECAERGELRAFAIVAVLGDGSCGTEWVHRFGVPGTAARDIAWHALGSGILMLAHRFGAAHTDE